MYGKRRISAALLEEHEMIVNHKLVEAIMRGCAM
ncbi:MAG TPA: IS3 family transposase [Umezawaea sp.]|nr:IS3 family transposase [Umezawaea sp.]